MHVCMHAPVFHPYVKTPICGCMCPRFCECTVKLKFPGWGGLCQLSFFSPAPQSAGPLHEVE